MLPDMKSLIIAIMQKKDAQDDSLFFIASQYLRQPSPKKSSWVRVKRVAYIWNSFQPVGVRGKSGGGHTGITAVRKNLCSTKKKQTFFLFFFVTPTSGFYKLLTWKG